MNTSIGRLFKHIKTKFHHCFVEESLSLLRSAASFRALHLPSTSQGIRTGPFQFSVSLIVRSLGTMTGYNIENSPYVVLLGDVGTGKSTIVEKVANVTNLVSDGDSSVTKSSKVFFSSDGSLLVGDTPGSNAMEDKFKHNLWIAAALNFKPVSKVLCFPFYLN